MFSGQVFLSSIFALVIEFACFDHVEQKAKCLTERGKKEESAHFKKTVGF